MSQESAAKISDGDGDPDINEAPNVKTQDETVMKCVFNASTYDRISTPGEDYGEDDFCLWPPMLVVCEVATNLEHVRKLLAAKGFRESDSTVSYTDINSAVFVTGRGLFVLPPTGQAFVAAKAIDAYFHASAPADKDSTCYYPSMNDIENDGIYESSIPVSARLSLCDLLSLNSDSQQEDDRADCSTAIWYETVQAAIRGIRDCEGDSGSRMQSDDPSESFIEKLKTFDNESMKEIEEFMASVKTEESLMQQLWSFNGTSTAQHCVNRLKLLHKLFKPGVDKPAVRHMVQGGEAMELEFMRAVEKEVQLQKDRKKELEAVNMEAEKAALELRKQQQQELLKLLLELRAARVATLEGFVSEKLKFMDKIRTAKKETGSIRRWVTQSNASVHEKLRRIVMEKWKLEDRVSEAEAELQNTRRDLDEVLQDGAEKSSCAICLLKLEGSLTKKRCQEPKLRKRACFVPCMHAAMCCECAVKAWEKFGKCPVCNVATSSRPLPIFL